MARWLAARARNALRRPLRIMGFTVTAFLMVLLALVLIPRHAIRAARVLLQGTDHRPDTVAITNRIQRVHVVADAADLALEHARARAHDRLLHPLPADTATSVPMPHLDSVALEVTELGRLLAHTEEAPLSASFRALANARAMRNDPYVHTLLDSLTDFERARNAFNAGGGVDPIYVALTAQINTIGHSLERVAEAKRAALRAANGMSDEVVTPTRIPFPDTIDPAARADTAHRVLAAMIDTLDTLRAVNVTLEARAEQAREVANVSAPPLALLGAALVLGAALGFAITMGIELSDPRVADGSEAARVAKARLLGVIEPPPTVPDRTRRTTDASSSPLLDLNSHTYRFLYLQVASTRPASGEPPLILFTGEEMEVTAAVTTNVAIAAAYDSRSVVLIDADRRAGMASQLLGARQAPGMAEALAGRVPWPATIVAATVGRDRGIDVIPPGNSALRDEGEGEGETSLDDEVRQDALRLARRYDVVVMSAPEGSPELERPAAVPVFANTVVSHVGAPDVVVCARVAYTPLAKLRRMADALRERGFHVRGVVLWDVDVPGVMRLRVA